MLMLVYISSSFTKTNLPLLFCIFADIRLELWETSRPKSKHKQINLLNIIKSQNELKRIKTFQRFDKMWPKSLNLFSEGKGAIMIYGGVAPKRKGLGKQNFE